MSEVKGEGETNYPFLCLEGLWVSGRTVSLIFNFDSKWREWPASRPGQFTCNLRSGYYVHEPYHWHQLFVLLESHNKSINNIEQIQWTLESRTQSVPQGGSTFNLFDFRVKFPHKE
jgi:hypothetical protein